MNTVEKPLPWYLQTPVGKMPGWQMALLAFVSLTYWYPVLYWIHPAYQQWKYGMTSSQYQAYQARIDACINNPPRGVRFRYGDYFDRAMGCRSWVRPR